MLSRCSGPTGSEHDERRADATTAPVAAVRPRHACLVDLLLAGGADTLDFVFRISMSIGALLSVDR
jgi:hypothetical protein